jgi:hypothetical protein
MNYKYQNPFWGSFSPLGGLTGFGLLIIASSRLSWAILVAVSIIWVYIICGILGSILSSKKINKFFPVHGRVSIYTCLAFLFSAIFLFLIWMFSPLASLEVFLPVLLIPFFYIGSGCFNDILKSENVSADISVNIKRNVISSASEAVILAVILIAFSIIREPLSFNTLTVPGTNKGSIALLSFKEDAFFQIKILANSAGALLLLGYSIGIYKYLRSIYAPLEGDQL